MIKKILLAPSEIVDVIVDFSESKSDSAILANGAAYPYPSGDPVNKFNGNVMKFIIKRQREVDTSRVPKRLIKYPSPDLSNAAATRYIAMYEYTSPTDEPTHLFLNGKPYEAPATETPKEGTKKAGGRGKVQGVHVKINNAVKCQISKYARGNITAVPAHEQGWKNVFKMTPGYVTKILVRFAYIHSNASYPFDASAEPGYVYHCHEIMTAAMQIPNRASSSRMLCNLRFVFLRGSNAGHFTTFKDAPFHKPVVFPVTISNKAEAQSRRWDTVLYCIE
ncbi:Multicopper oxidase LPR1 [Vitis vinifera]|uniref:Multicopper oxidase LPR1 n=1 Tax=Vitis vinifera TaxID=29760 RepID=A0A438C1E1_VITVI|nr:Multicopper oxidase LPR1 [Vitis vinifera]